MCQQVVKPCAGLQFNCVVGTLSPFGKTLVKNVPSRRNFISQRVEEISDKRLSSSAGQHRNGRAERELRIGKLRTRLTSAAESRAKTCEIATLRNDEAT
jgi:hypothetical protein